MKPLQWIIRRLFALALLLAGLIYGAWIYTKGDTGGAVACVAGAMLIASIVINEG
jgi:hypothetical protein